MGGAGGVTPLHGRAPVGGVPVDPTQPTFKDVLLENLSKVNELQQEATTAIEDISAGRRDDLEGVLLATQKADLAFRTLLSVRNKVQDAFEEVKQMRV
jgi:flagellar hook-basal body complex protein FliE